MRPPKDKVLNKLAHEAEHFDFNLHTKEEFDAFSFKVSGDLGVGERKGFYPCFNNPDKWMVRFFLVGKQHTVAFADHVFKAAKLFDVTVLHFQTFRRDYVGVEHQDARYNFSKKDAQLTLQMYPEIGNWLIALETHLHFTFKLTPWADQEKQKAINSSDATIIRRERRTVRGEIIQYLGAFQDRLDEVVKALAVLQRTVETALPVKV